MNFKKDEDEFYIGYFAKAPVHTAIFLRQRVSALFGILLILGAIFGFVFQQMDRGSFAFGMPRYYRGTLYAEPIPILRTTDRAFVLVGDGKFGSEEWAKKWSSEAKGKEIELEASLIERDPIAMLEIDRKSTPRILESPANAPKLPVSADLGQVELQGELVDSKCYLGVMRPAIGKVHRACAIRCLSGGVPPGLLLRRPNINTSVLIFLTQGADKNIPKIASQWAGRTINVKGHLEIDQGLPVLQLTEINLVSGNANLSR